MFSGFSNLLTSLKDGVVVFLRAVLKAVSGFIIVPLSILVGDLIMPEWEKASKPVKYITGIVLVPIMGFLSFASPWWDDFDIKP